MKKHKIWGLATLILLLGIATVFILLDQNAELHQLEKETAESDKLRQERNKPQETPQVVDVSDNTQRPPPPGETHQQDTGAVTIGIKPNLSILTLHRTRNKVLIKRRYPRTCRCRTFHCQPICRTWIGSSGVKAPGRMGEIHPRPRSGDRKTRQRD